MKNYILELFLTFVSILFALVFYFFTKEKELAFVLGLLMSALSIYVGIIKHSVDNLLKKSVKIYQLRTDISSPFLRDRADKILESSIRQLRQLNDGHYLIQGIEAAFAEVRKFYDMAKRGDSLRSIVLVSNETVLDGLYHSIHQNTLEQGAHITKIYIVPQNDLSHRISEFQLYSNSGVKVRIIFKETLHMDPRLIDDFFIYNDRVLGTSILDSNGQLASIEISIRQEDLDEYLLKFKELYSVSYSLDDISNISESQDVD